MKKRIWKAEDFGEVLDVLAEELVSASFHWQLHQGLSQAGSEYGREFSQSPTFWGLTQKAHIDATLLHLCKAYDQDSRSLNLGTLLQSIRSNPQLFEEAAFRERLKENPHVDSLSERAGRPDEAQLRAHSDFVGRKNNPVVRNLVEWRNQFYAHRDPRKVLAGTRLADQYPLSFADIERLLSEGTHIVSHWSISCALGFSWTLDCERVLAGGVSR